MDAIELKKKWRAGQPSPGMWLRLADPAVVDLLTDVGLDWVLFDARNPYGGSLDPAGTGCPPTPGWTDRCTGSVPTEGRTFGAVKAFYR